MWRATTSGAPPSGAAFWATFRCRATRTRHDPSRSSAEDHLVRGQGSDDACDSKLLQPMLVDAHTSQDLGRVLTKARRSIAAPVLAEPNGRSDLQAGRLVDNQAA